MSVNPVCCEQHEERRCKIYRKAKFKYDKENDKYICPEGKRLELKRTKKGRKGMNLKIYRGQECKNCIKKFEFTRSRKNREIERWEKEEIIEEMALRMEAEPEKYGKRKTIVEPVFGILKRSMGFSYLLLKGKEKVNTEIGLMTLAYNMKRAINELGIKKLIESMA